MANKFGHNLWEIDTAFSTPVQPGRISVSLIEIDTKAGVPGSAVVIATKDGVNVYNATPGSNTVERIPFGCPQPLQDLVVSTIGANTIVRVYQVA